MGKITPFLWFDDKAEEAANFYVSVFKDAKIIGESRYGEAGPGKPGSVMTMDIELHGLRFGLLNGGPLFKFTEAVSFVINCADQAEIDYYWEKLTEGGEPSQCGWLKDKFGLSWQVVPEALGELLGGSDPGASQRAMAAMLKMEKLDIAALQAARDSKN
ncbi:MAG TPA: VOC family protein [Patescibacteria group bacterium]|nr:VOC family protein [Patescibacteria group bacterium]